MKHSTIPTLITKYAYVSLFIFILPLSLHAQTGVDSFIKEIKSNYSHFSKNEKKKVKKFIKTAVKTNPSLNSPDIQFLPVYTIYAKRGCSWLSLIGSNRRVKKEELFTYMNPSSVFIDYVLAYKGDSCIAEINEMGVFRKRKIQPAQRPSHLSQANFLINSKADMIFCFSDQSYELFLLKNEILSFCTISNQELHHYSISDFLNHYLTDEVMERFIWFEQKPKHFIVD